MEALGWKDHLIRREKVLVVVFTAWLTITVSLYVFVSSNSAPPITTIRGTDDITHVHPKQTNPLHRSAHDKFQTWAYAQRPLQHNDEETLAKSREERTGMKEHATAPKAGTTIVRQPQEPLANAIPTRQRTAKEKLAEYAKASLQRKTTTTGSALQQPRGQQLDLQPLVTDTNKTPRLRKTAHNKLQAYAHTTLERRPNQEEAPPMTHRQKFDAHFPPSDNHRIRSFVASLRTTKVDEGIRQATSLQQLAFDPFDCPETPPPNYPLHYSLVDMLKDWPVDQLQWPDATTYDEDSRTIIHHHPYLYHSLCIFDWDRPEHRQRMRRYQIDYDVPFVLRNQPEFMQAAERWMHPNYLQRLIGHEPHRTEHSFQTNHLPFWRTKGLRHVSSDWKAPTENMFMTYPEWSERANAMDRVAAQQSAKEGESFAHAQLDHYYFRLNAKDKEQNAYLYDELPVFDPALSQDGENLFMLHPKEERGINCRFGMAGNVAEAHYDYSSNWITLLGGHRRYILAHPRECQNLALFPKGHPSARHSSVNWSKITSNKIGDGGGVEYGGSSMSSGVTEQVLSAALATQVILQASDALYLPTNWLHFIVSLDRNYQCNSRSGIRTEYNSFIEECGFTLA